MMKINGLIILIATAAVLFSMSSLPTVDALRHWLNHIKNKFTPGCAYCDRSEICRNGRCVNACFGASCNLNEGCQVTNDHYASCQCLPGFIRDHNRNCVLDLQPVCHSNMDCDSSEICRNNECINACYKKSCKLNEACQVTNHESSCVCLPKFVRDPVNQNCVPKLQPVCHSNMDCDSSEICQNNKCINACYKKSCKSNEACQITNHKSSCVCLPNFVRDPENQNCVPIRMCSDNTDCGSTEVCKHGSCVSACHKQTCKIANETCQVTNFHSFSCECSPGYMRVASNQCSPICSNNNDCGINEECTTINHIPMCKCRTGYLPYDPTDVAAGYGCYQYCGNNSDCGLQYKCKDHKCIPACEFGTCAKSNAKCVEINHVGTCRCPSGFVGDPNVKCVRTCIDNTVCGDLDVCINGNCTNACANHRPCGEKAHCSTLRHVSQCRCDKGYIGDPYSKCAKICDNHDVCKSYESCDLIYEERPEKVCASICERYGCGDNAKCYADNHEGNCTCDSGFIARGTDCIKE